MKVIIDEAGISVEGEPPVDLQGATAQQVRMIGFLRAITWAMERLGDELAVAVAEHHTELVIATAKRGPKEKNK